MYVSTLAAAFTGGQLRLRWRLGMGQPSATIGVVARKTPLSYLADRAPVGETAVRDAALTVFARFGYHGTAVRNIAEELRIRAPSLYNHMDSKQELLRAIVQETTELVWSEFEAAVEGVTEPAGQLRS